MIYLNKVQDISTTEQMIALVLYKHKECLFIVNGSLASYSCASALCNVLRVFLLGSNKCKVKSTAFWDGWQKAGFGKNLCSW